jgi:rod shape determining protein RodA
LKHLPANSAPREEAPGRLPIRIRGVRWSKVPWHVLLLGVALLMVGLSFQRAMSEAEGGVGISFRGHMQKLVVSLPVLLCAFLVRPRWLRRRWWWVYGASLGLLMLVPFIGVDRNNARRWIDTPVFDLQPSEFMKVALILGLAGALYRNRLARFKDWLLPLGLALVPMGLVALQPDLGTALTIVPVTLGMLYLAGASGRVLTTTIVCVSLVAFTAVRFELGVREYQLERIDTWTQSYWPEDLIEGRRGPAFHAYHARVAIGNGGMTGRGLGQGIANQAGILPERESDSIVAVIAEEGGWWGATGMLVLYTLFVLGMMQTAVGLRDRHARLVLGGVALYFGSHVFIHSAVNLGLLPLTGLTLPLLSTGGSSLLASFAALGLALGCAANHEAALDRDAFRSY